MRLTLLLALLLATPATAQRPVYSVKAYGAKGDGNTLDTRAINRAMDAAARAGGGTVYFPAGTYPSFSIQLQSHVALHLEPGATLLAADTSRGEVRCRRSRGRTTSSRTSATATGTTR